MRFYIYNLLITFDIKIFKLIKNAFIFTILGFGRNILAVLGIAFLIIIHVLLIWLLLPVGISIPIILPFFYIFAATAFMGTYAAYPIIDKYMIAPYAVENTEDFVYLKDHSNDSEESEEAAISENVVEEDTVEEEKKTDFAKDNKNKATKKHNSKKSKKNK